MTPSKENVVELTPAERLRDRQCFHVVAIPKFLLMTVLSLGTYTHYWYYRNWMLYRGQRGFKWLPLLCSVLGHLLIYPLAKIIEKRFTTTGQSDGFSALRISCLFWLPYLLLLGWLIFIPERWAAILPNSIIFVIPVALSVTCWILPLVALAHIQQAINILEGDELGVGNSRVTGMNRLWLYVSWLPLFLMADFLVRLAPYLP